VPIKNFLIYLCIGNLTPYPNIDALKHAYTYTDTNPNHKPEPLDLSLVELAYTLLSVDPIYSYILDYVNEALVFLMMR